MKQHLPPSSIQSFTFGSRIISSKIAWGVISKSTRQRSHRSPHRLRYRKLPSTWRRSPRVLVHRDFQSQNIIIRNSYAYLIDFQGMRPGLAEYDLASLLYDPYVDLPEVERSELAGYYRQSADRKTESRSTANSI